MSVILPIVSLGFFFLIFFYNYVTVMICLGSRKLRKNKNKNREMGSFREWVIFVWWLRKCGKRKENVVFNFKIFAYIGHMKEINYTKTKAQHYFPFNFSVKEGVSVCFSIIFVWLPDYDRKK